MTRRRRVTELPDSDANETKQRCCLVEHAVDGRRFESGGDGVVLLRRVVEQEVFTQWEVPMVRVGKTHHERVVSVGPRAPLATDFDERFSGQGEQ